MNQKVTGDDVNAWFCIERFIHYQSHWWQKKTPKRRSQKAYNAMALLLASSYSCVFINKEDDLHPLPSHLSRTNQKAGLQSGRHEKMKSEIRCVIGCHSQIVVQNGRPNDSPDKICEDVLLSKLRRVRCLGPISSKWWLRCDLVCHAWRTEEYEVSHQKSGLGTVSRK